MFSFRQSRFCARGRDCRVDHFGMSRQRNIFRIAVAAARTGIGHHACLLACRLRRHLAHIAVPERLYIIAMICPAADRAGIDRVADLRTRRRNRLSRKIFVFAVCKQGLCVHEQVVIDLLCKRRAIHKGTNVGVFPGEAARNDVAFAQGIFHERRLAARIAQDDVCAFGQPGKSGMAAERAVQDTVRDPDAARQNARDDIVRGVGDIVPVREEFVQADAAGQRVGQIARRPTVIAGAIDEYAAVLRKLRQFLIEQGKAIVGRRRLVVGDIDEIVIGEVERCRLLRRCDLPAAKLSCIGEVVEQGDVAVRRPRKRVLNEQNIGAARVEFGERKGVTVAAARTGIGDHALRFRRGRERHGTDVIVPRFHRNGVPELISAHRAAIELISRLRTSRRNHADKTVGVGCVCVQSVAVAAARTGIDDGACPQTGRSGHFSANIVVPACRNGRRVGIPAHRAGIEPKPRLRARRLLGDDACTGMPVCGQRTRLLRAADRTGIDRRARLRTGGLLGDHTGIRMLAFRDDLRIIVATTRTGVPGKSGLHAGRRCDDLARIIMPKCTNGGRIAVTTARAGVLRKPCLGTRCRIENLARIVVPERRKRCGIAIATTRASILCKSRLGTRRIRNDLTHIEVTDHSNGRLIIVSATRTGIFSKPRLCARCLFNHFAGIRMPECIKRRLVAVPARCTGICHNACLRARRLTGNFARICMFMRRRPIIVIHGRRYGIILNRRCRRPIVILYGRRHGIVLYRRRFGLASFGRRHGIVLYGRRFGLASFGRRHGIVLYGRRFGLASFGRSYGIVILRRRHGIIVIRRGDRIIVIGRRHGIVLFGRRNGIILLGRSHRIVVGIAGSDDSCIIVIASAVAEYAIEQAACGKPE